ncbi:sensor domain-containing diguanylate cyclase [Vibrio nitrifigilis]|uniref:diguanylate cyclase n=1 Tax=Vibrio nitrifigilis TaxID=2789781 RepID=A0ABS0GHC9_9VIBR|nr:sensor domain-containing diguanylate cyclase [Vibrio nitrifigilis]MBF9001847.1 sensor domain-containing diguanylate cyclase [Vibrio nitrifigilis]
MKRFKRTLHKAALLWLVASLIPIAYYFYQTSTAHEFLRQQVEKQGFQFLSYVSTRTNRTSTQIQQTFDELSRSALLYDYAEHPSEKLKHYLTSQWYLTSFNSKLFYQLRYLDKSGNENIRIDYTPDKEFPYVVPTAMLQSKGHRDYFHYAQQLKPGEEGAFGIDLEYEHQKPVIPYKPGLRLIFPIDAPKQRLGYFIANLDVLALIHNVTENSQNLSIDFVDKSGFYIISSDNHKLFGDLILERASFNLPAEQPDVWQAISDRPNRQGSIYTDNGLYVFQPFANALFANSGPMSIITHYSPQQLAQVYAARDRVIQSDSVLIWFACGLFSVLWAQLWETYRQNKMDRTYAEFVMENGMAIALTDNRHKILRTNNQFSDLVGISSSRLSGQNLLYFQPTKETQAEMLNALEGLGEWQGEFVLKSPNGEMVVCQTSVKALKSKRNHVDFYVYSFADISAHHQAIMDLKEKSELDPTTSLWNKKKFDQNLEYYSRLKQRYPEQTDSCLAIIDIDSFKSINDHQGHAVGDEVIMFVAVQLKSLLRDTDFIARIGGDEFAVIVQHSDLKHAANLMNRIRISIASWPKHNVSISAGIALVSEDPQQTFSYADQALYRSKRKGKNCVSIHGIERLSLVESDSETQVNNP